MALTVQYRSRLAVKNTGAPDIGQATYSSDEAHEVNFAEGTGAGKADRQFSGTRTVSASSSETLDLAGTLANAFGTVTFAKVKVIRVRAAAGNTNNVVVGGAASNAFVGPFADATDKISIAPGGEFSIVHPGDGWAVTAGTGDLLQFANSSSGSSVTYDVEIIGASA